jgi:hypothetical protein
MTTKRKRSNTTYSRKRQRLNDEYLHSSDSSHFSNENAYVGNKKLRRKKYNSDEYQYAQNSNFWGINPFFQNPSLRAKNNRSVGGKRKRTKRRNRRY